MDPRETERRVLDAERDVQRDLAHHRRTRYWGSTPTEIGRNVGAHLGVLVCLLIPAFLILKAVIN
jgi:hypothetical protein